MRDYRDESTTARMNGRMARPLPYHRTFNSPELARVWASACAVSQRAALALAHHGGGRYSVAELAVSRAHAASDARISVVATFNAAGRRTDV